MPKLTFYPLGNADCCLINLQNGKRVLFDYAAMRDQKNEDDKRIDLPKELRDDLDKSSKKKYEVVAFTHLDYDHTQGADEFFYFDHADKYQGKDRM